MMDIPHPYLKSVDIENAFKLKRDHDEVIAEVLTLEALRSAIERAPDNVISFHLNGRNDFANWIQGAIGCNSLSKAIAEIRFKAENPEETRLDLLKTLDLGIDLLREKV